MTLDELKDCSNKRKAVIYNGSEYLCVGSQMINTGKEKIISAGLQDSMRRIVWVKAENVEIKT